ncbi:two-component system sensor histidine kinase NtrB [Desulfobacter curvatus]|uniref:two-component system sensor histidine kinase NtrB n=1 Tax=Desulfobacter curvatus TaxID=2290 RepID=UPI0003790655|nr:ATP-binding protein [Desulfobacter curvatus]
MKKTTLDDIIGLKYTKLGFFPEAKHKMIQLKAANIRLERKSQKLQAILDGISDVMVIMSLNFTIITVNRLFSDVFDCKQPEGKTCFEVFTNRTTPCPDCPVALSLKDGQVCRQTRIYMIKDKKRQFEVSVSPMTDAHGKIFRFMLLMRDVTREKAYQESYYYSTKMATVGLLAAGVAHEINNPLTSIHGFSEGLKRRLPRLRECLENNPGTDDLAADFNEYIDTIIAECDRCRDIVKNLLTFSPRKRIDFSRVDLKEMVTDVIKLLHFRLRQESGVTIELDMPKDIPKIKGNAPEIKQVLLNIICNAIDAVEGRGRLDISVEVKKKWIALSVRDNGYGICDEDMERLFDPFFTTKPPGKGTGIGLSTCYNIIQQHQGRILVDSEPDKGSVFHICFPLEEKETDE